MYRCAAHHMPKLQFQQTAREMKFYGKKKSGKIVIKKFIQVFVSIKHLSPSLTIYSKTHDPLTQYISNKIDQILSEIEMLRVHIFVTTFYVSIQIRQRSFKIRSAFVCSKFDDLISI